MSTSPKVYVLRWGHRARDFRLTTHVALVSRAFGASGLYLADVADEGLKKTVEKVIETWGGEFELIMAVPWKRVVQEWKSRGVIVHLTMYGENMGNSDVVDRIRKTGRDILLIVGSRKVPSAFYTLSDFNVAVGNQPHSEVAAIALFLDRFFMGRELSMEFENAKRKISPSAKGKMVWKTP
ncbi:MAG: tRNA (cytidine(56)-2'-O)-methyltransferase [Candidatus Bathyarchaeia archaeon]